EHPDRRNSGPTRRDGVVGRVAYDHASAWMRAAEPAQRRFEDVRLGFGLRSVVLRRLVVHQVADLEQRLECLQLVGAGGRGESDALAPLPKANEQLPNAREWLH